MKNNSGKKAYEYSDNRRISTNKYRQAAQKQVTVSFKKEVEPVIAESAKKNGLTVPSYLKKLAEDDYNNKFMALPQVKKGETAKWLLPVFSARKLSKNETVLGILAHIDGNDLKAISVMCTTAGGVSPSEMLTYIIETCSADMTFGIAEILMRCFEAEDGIRSHLLDAIRDGGFDVNDRLYLKGDVSLFGSPGRKAKNQHEDNGEA